ncbi:MAG: hypothetical protein K2O59_01645 [Lachnospiraceae bacterium]|nr:hypothetical protein [Lachnospiraceae bacterium]MDE7176494.1 hypothetical protein [Lachnospiraceae bacterium]
MLLFIYLIALLCLLIKISRQPDITCQYGKQYKIKPKPNYPVIERKVIYKKPLWMEDYLEKRLDEIKDKIARQDSMFSFYVGDLTEEKRNEVLEWFVSLPTTKTAYLEDEQIRCTNF